MWLAKLRKTSDASEIRSFFFLFTSDFHSGFGVSILVSGRIDKADPGRFMELGIRGLEWRFSLIRNLQT